MIKKLLLPKLAAVFFAAAFAFATAHSATAATIVILNNDSAGVGFNDTTPVSPVGNNTGTTLGQQRLNAFQFAANIWGATINSNVTITVRANWGSPSGWCSANGATLGATNPITISANFTNAPGVQQNAWYAVAEAN